MHQEEIEKRTRTLRYRCHKLRSQIWDMDKKKECLEAYRWVQGHIGESLKTASYEELKTLEGYLSYKLEHGHCPIHEDENAKTRYKRDGGSSQARQKIKEKLIELHGEKCVECKKMNIPLTLDHIHPIALGGKNTLENTQLLCIPCHTEKTKDDSKKAYKIFFEKTFPHKVEKRRKERELKTTKN